MLKATLGNQDGDSTESEIHRDSIDEAHLFGL